MFTDILNNRSLILTNRQMKNATQQLHNNTYKVGISSYKTNSTFSAEVDLVKLIQLELN